MERQPANLVQTVRASEWWEFKLSPLLATVYATSFYLGGPLNSLWSLLLLLLVAVVPGAAYVSLINDLTDLNEDLISGKRNRMIGRSRTFIIVVLAACLLPGILVSTYWRNDPLLLCLYLAAWVAFSLYSIPPVRLKARGVAGLFADACGAHLFPTLVAITLVYRRRGTEIDPVWFTSVAIWSLSFGLRGNLWHQLTDLHHDQIAGLGTFARRHNIARLHWVGHFVIFPLELVSFALIIARTGSNVAILFLWVYTLLELSRRAMWKMNLVIVAPKDRFSILMFEYYEVFFPIGILLSSALRHPADLIVLIVHLVLFPRRAAQIARDVLKLLKQAAHNFV
jgi:4-hydroxybenzoate polyprenyltransferase